MLKRWFLRAVLVFLCAEFFAGPYAGESLGESHSQVYQTPPVLYVGDRGRLVYTLDVFMPMPENDAVFHGGLPKTDDISILKIELDRRGRRLTIDFQAFRTGTVPLPPIPFGGVEIKGLQVNIASIVDTKKNALSLSPSAGLLAAPGTFWIITAVFASAAALLLALVLLYTKGGTLFSNTRNAVRTRLLRLWINRRLRRIEKRLRLGKLSEKESLSGMSNGVRVFLSRFWLRPCYAMSAEEFPGLRLPGAARTGELMSGIALFFKRCDKVRFGGETVDRETVNAICAEARALVNSRDLIGQ
jgi:hypothetical protein